MPYLQNAKRFAATNGETLTTRCAELRQLMIEFGFDAQRIWNLDETGISPGKDVRGSACEKRMHRRGSQKEARVPVFADENRVTIIPVVSAAGVVGPSLWIFQGTRIPCRDVLIGGKRYTHTLSTFLPAHGLVHMELDRRTLARIVSINGLRPLQAQ